MEYGPDAYDLPAVGSAVRYWREQRRLTQAELALGADVGVTHLSRLERGEHEIRLSTIWRLATVLEIDPRVLLEAPPVEAA